MLKMVVKMIFLEDDMLTSFDKNTITKISHLLTTIEALEETIDKQMDTLDKQEELLIYEKENY